MLVTGVAGVDIDAHPWRKSHPTASITKRRRLIGTSCGASVSQSRRHLHGTLVPAGCSVWRARRGYGGPETAMRILVVERSEERRVGKEGGGQWAPDQ